MIIDARCGPISGIECRDGLVNLIETTRQLVLIFRAISPKKPDKNAYEQDKTVANLQHPAHAVSARVCADFASK